MEWLVFAEEKLLPFHEILNWSEILELHLSVVGPTFFGPCSSVVAADDVWVATVILESPFFQMVYTVYFPLAMIIGYGDCSC